MARDNTISITYTQQAGDGASGFSESSGAKNFTSGDAVKIEGTITHVAKQMSVAEFGFTQADGIYCENRGTGILTFELMTDASTTTHLFQLPPNGGMMCVRFDATQTAITYMKLTGVTTDLALQYVLCFSE